MFTALTLGRKTSCTRDLGNAILNHGTIVVDRKTSMPSTVCDYRRISIPPTRTFRFFFVAKIRVLFERLLNAVVWSVFIAYSNALQVKTMGPSPVHQRRLHWPQFLFLHWSQTNKTIRVIWNRFPRVFITQHSTIWKSA